MMTIVSMMTMMVDQVVRNLQELAVVNNTCRVADLIGNTNNDSISGTDGGRSVHDLDALAGSLLTPSSTTAAAAAASVLGLTVAAAGYYYHYCHRPISKKERNDTNDDRDSINDGSTTRTVTRSGGGCGGGGCSCHGGGGFVHPDLHQHTDVFKKQILKVDLGDEDAGENDEDDTSTTTRANVYVAIGYGLANCIIIDDPQSDGIIIVDTTESPDAARELLARLS